MAEVIQVAVADEPGSRTAMKLNCAARLLRPIGKQVGEERECKRMARKGDYCVQHWQMNYGHEFNLLTWTCKCGVKWNASDSSEVCPGKITYVTFSKAG